jgi:hypothetical protein
MTDVIMNSAITDNYELHEYEIKDATHLLIDEITEGICHSCNCEFKMDLCSHTKLSKELLQLTINHYALFLEKNNEVTAAQLLRSQM